VPIRKRIVEINRIKLLKFLHTFEIGGTERQVVTLARKLDPAKFDLSMACFYKMGPFLQDIERRRIPLKEYGVRSLRSATAFREALRCAGDLRRDRTEIVHAYGFYSNVFAIPAARLAGVPVVIGSIRDTVEGPPLQRRAHKLVCRLADCVLVNAEVIKQRLIAEGYNGSKIRVIKNGIDLSRFAKKNEDCKVRLEFGLPPAAPLVVVLARLSRFKGIEYFLQAAAIVAKRIEEARFLIVGDLKYDQAYRTELKRQATRLGIGRRVIFTGFRLDVPEVLSEASISVLPCHSAEGLSNSLLESMAVGLPVVATTVGGNPEVVEEGTTGLLVPPREPEALARAISLLLANPETARRFGAAGRQRVARHFSLERMTRDTEELYSQLLETARRRTASANADGRFSRRWRRSRNLLRSPR
jgi:glycosyltransferase involved in cell wall biosynthesis